MERKRSEKKSEIEQTAVAIVSSPIGGIRITATGRGIRRIEIAIRGGGAGKSLEGEGKAAFWLTQAVKEIKAYFTKKSFRSFTVPIDFGDAVTSFARRALEAAGRIPFGETRSYKEVAASAGNPRAARAVGGAMSRNPVALIIPCHRVVASDASLGGFTGGLHLKRTLLDHEAKK
jgi:O-6-methylguanine DNA methyltransferase